MQSFNRLKLCSFVFMGLRSLAIAAETTQTPLPWQITGISTHSPSGMPGTALFCTMGVTIKDSNTIDLGETRFGEVIIPPTEVNCSARWECSESPYDVVWGCGQTDDSLWTFQILEAQNTTSPGPTENFDLAFRLVIKVAMGNYTSKSVYAGREHFEVGKNLHGTCGGSGQCNWGLKENTTVTIQQAKVN